MKRYWNRNDRKCAYSTSKIGGDGWAPFAIPKTLSGAYSLTRWHKCQFHLHKYGMANFLLIFILEMK